MDMSGSALSADHCPLPSDDRTGSNTPWDTMLLAMQ
jgi:hypothetical protein